MISFVACTTWAQAVHPSTVIFFLFMTSSLGGIGQLAASGGDSTKIQSAAFML